MNWEDLKIPMLVSSIIFFLIALYTFAIRKWKFRARVGQYPFLYGLDSKKVKMNMKIKFELPYRDKIQLKILDEKEGLIFQITDSVFEKGTHSFDYDASQLMAGKYSYQLTSTRQKSTKNFEKV